LAVQPILARGKRIDGPTVASRKGALSESW
jgi:hypothetical protein